MQSGRGHILKETSAATQALRIVLFSLGHFGHVTEESITVSSMSLCLVKCKRSEEKTSSADGFSLSPKEKRNKQVFTLAKTCFLSKSFKKKKAKSLRKLKITGQL